MNKSKRLILFDHDGTLCHTKVKAYESLVFALHEALKFIGHDIKIEDIDINEILSAETGTTEKNFVRSLALAFEVSYDNFEKFENEFYKSRANWYKYLKLSNKSDEEEYFSDAINLITLLKSDPSNVLGIVTGNPKSVFDLRTTNFIKENFSKMPNGDILGAYGEEAYSRKELIQLAIDRAEKNNSLEVGRDYLQFTTNVWYVADSKKDFYASLDARCRFIWIPSRSLQSKVEVESEDYIRYIKSLLTDRVLITNILDAPEIKCVFE